MNWRYVPGSGAVLSPDELRVGERCAQLSGTSGARHSLSSGKRAAICRLFQSGMTCDPLTADRGVALWISSLADSRASRSVSPENGKASTTHGTCGLKLHASLENVSLAGYFSKTCRHSYLPGMEPLFSLYSGVWIRSGTMLRGVIYPLERSVLHMPANEYGLWVGTPTCGQGLQSDAFRRHGHTPTPAELAAMFPHPGTGLAAMDRAAIAAMSQKILGRLLGGRLNPTWIEWLMGYPDGWTVFAD